jgi:hypothetical protein
MKNDHELFLQIVHCKFLVIFVRAEPLLANLIRLNNELMKIHS